MAGRLYCLPLEAINRVRREVAAIKQRRGHHGIVVSLVSLFLSTLHLTPSFPVYFILVPLHAVSAQATDELPNGSLCIFIVLLFISQHTCNEIACHNLLLILGSSPSHDPWKLFFELPPRSLSCL